MFEKVPLYRQARSTFGAEVEARAALVAATVQDICVCVKENVLLPSKERKCIYLFIYQEPAPQEVQHKNTNHQENFLSNLL